MMTPSLETEIITVVIMRTMMILMSLDWKLKILS